MTMPHLPGRRAKSWTSAIAEGALFALLGLFVHRHAWDAAGISWPWGALLGISAAAMRCRVIRHECLANNQGAGIAGGFALSWLAVTTLAAMQHADVLVANDVLGTGYLLAGTIVIATAATWPAAQDRQRRR